ncbi:kinase-like protein [Macrolepiota fuliginosa MF-IS2]|uniref:Kinase-like protein n=1 Tax=Macrolepiota fuliginosa MF-IS2 TaxID=1400762 RepID=A0A9P6C1E9_9AGAR|nr:kinase-like protein [Macrolepiota fuliginosa MF-IS2]
MVDFLSTILSEEKEILSTDEGNRILIMLHKLAASAGVFPKRFVPRDLVYDPVFVAMGGFAPVHGGRYRERNVCVKLLFEYVDEKVCLCLFLLAHLSHPNILSFYGVAFGDNSRTRLISPWMTNGTLCTYSSKPSQTSRMPLIFDVIDGLLYLHNLNVVHSCLRGEDVLVSDEGRALIADFGLSHISTSTAMRKCASSLIGASTCWAPPEFFDQDPDVSIRPAKAWDVWSFGCLCYEVLSRRPPFYQCRADFHVMRALVSKEIPLRPGPGHSDWDEIGGGMWALMETCWSYAPEARPTLRDFSGRFSRLGIPDDRPEVQDGPGSGLAQENPIELDFDRVEKILLNVIKSQCP